MSMARSPELRKEVDRMKEEQLADDYERENGMDRGVYEIRKFLSRAISLLVILTSTVLMMWKTLICITGSLYPIGVILSGSMEPGFQKGDILFVHMGKDPIRAGEIVVYNVEGHGTPVVHRVIKVHERQGNGEVDFLTKGDKNPDDDISFDAPDQHWLQQEHIMGRAVGFLPYVGWAAIIIVGNPAVKYALFCAGALLVL